MTEPLSVWCNRVSDRPHISDVLVIDPLSVVVGVRATIGVVLVVLVTEITVGMVLMIEPISMVLVTVSISAVFMTGHLCFSDRADRLVGLVVRRPPRERKISGSNPACAGIFSGSSHTSDSKNWHSSGYPARCLAL